MGRSTRLHDRRGSLRPRGPRPLAAPTRSDEKVLGYGFLAIGAFLLGGGGYLAGVLSAWGFVGNVLLAFAAFMLCLRHLRAMEPS